MLQIGSGEMLIIFLVALVVLGPDKLPTVARQAGQFVNTLRGMAQTFQDELQKASQAHEPKALKPVNRSMESTADQTPRSSAIATDTADANGVADATAAQGIGQTHPDEAASDENSAESFRGTEFDLTARSAQTNPFKHLKPAPAPIDRIVHEADEEEAS